MTTISPLDVAGLSAAYGKTPILDDIGFTVRSGEVFGLVGLNGVGKTTLIRAILGLGPMTGAVRLFGIDNANPASRRAMVYLPEKFQPSPLLKGWEHLSITLAYWGLRLDRARAAQVAEGLDFDVAALSRGVRTYSKGMGQKLGLIATFLTDLPLLVLDEPMSGLDPRSRVLLKDRLLDYRAGGRSVFFSSHILADIEEICDRIGVLHRRRLIYLGPPADLIARTGAAGLERAFLQAIDEVDRA